MSYIRYDYSLIDTDFALTKQPHFMAATHTSNATVRRNFLQMQKSPQEQDRVIWVEKVKHLKKMKILL